MSQLIAKDLGKSYKSRRVVRALSLTVNSGEVVGSVRCV